MRRLPVILALVVAVVLAFGLLYTLKKDLEVAPWAKTANDGRLHYHTKNITRIGGAPEDVRRAIERAVYLDEPPATSAGAGASWQDSIRAQIRTPERPRHIVALPGEGEASLAWSLPGAFWAVYAQSPVIFVGRSAVGADASAAMRQLGQRFGKLPIYVLAPTSIISDETQRELSSFAPTRRVAADDLAAHAVAVAEYRDPATGFGWGRTHDERTGYFHFVMSAPSEAEQALAALPLAQSNSATFLFAGDDGAVPAATDRYIWGQRADWFVTPAEGPFRHLWLIGDRISYGAQGRLDLAPEKAPYLSMGPVALGPLEGLAIVFIALGIAGAIFVLLHSLRLLPEVMWPARIAWIFTALLLPVVGALLYLSAYRRPRLNPDERAPKWLRPPAVQAAAATAMGFGYGAPLMIVIGYLFVYFGFPLFFGEWADGWEFIFGAGMPLMMIGMYVFAVLLAWPLAQLPMRSMMSGESGWSVAWSALKVTALSMAAVSLGMMTINWWMMMWHLKMMPKEDETLWFGSMWLASAIGFLIAWPLNWPMVRGRLKPGTM